MLLYTDLAKKILSIKEAANAIETHGYQNANLVLRIGQGCDEIIQMMNESVQDDQNGSAEGSKNNGEQNFGASGNNQ